MSLLPKLIRSPKPVHVRPPDFLEARDGLRLQVWGEEGYWHVVDSEFADLLRVLQQPKLLTDIFRDRPDWGVHEKDVRRQLNVMAKSGVGGTRSFKPSPSEIENVTINLVTGCNLHCGTCYVPEELRSGQKLDPGEVLRFLDRLRPCLSRQATISLLGGEPFLHPQALLAIGRWATKHKIPCNVSTNGTLFSQQLLEILRETKLNVQVSLDGATAETNDAIRGAGTFQKAIATVRQLVEHAVPTTLCMVCCRQNISDIPDYFRLARELKVPEVRFIPLKKLGNSRNGAITPASQFEIVSAICRELDADPSLASMCRTDLYSIMRAMLRESSRRSTCGTGTETLLVHADGTVYPCINTSIPSLALGHINDGPAPILKNGGRFGKRLSVESLVHPCHGCFVKRWCLAVCPGETLQQEGELNRPHWGCADVRRTIIYVMWRLAEEKQSSKQHIARSLI